MTLKVYVSYAWKAEADSGVVAALETVLAGQGIELVRDVRRVGYGESIRAFMDEIGAADQVVLVLSEAYFRSPYCLYELRAVAEHRDFRRRVHPVVLAGCGIHDPLWWIDIVAHWEEQARVLEAKLAKISRAHIGPLNRAVDDYADFRRLVTGQMATLADMNALTEEVHRATEFAVLMRRIKCDGGPVVPPIPASMSEAVPEVLPPPVVQARPGLDVLTPWWAEKVEHDGQGAFINVEWLGFINRLDWDVRHKSWWGTNSVGVDNYGLFGEVDLNGVIQCFRWIPPGEFWMGAPVDELGGCSDERPCHQVRLTQGFWLADTVCSQDLWLSVMGSNPSQFADDRRNPVERVNFFDVEIFLRRVEQMISGYKSELEPNVRNVLASLPGFPRVRASLPTEVEWEYSCRAGSCAAFSWGNDIEPSQANYDGRVNYGGGSMGVFREKTIPVKAVEPNSWGLYQMHGNVWEWCADGFREFSNAPRVNPRGSEGDAPRMIRGGAWLSHPEMLRAAHRLRTHCRRRDSSLGFRFVLRPKFW